MGKLSSILLGTVSGAALALFLTSDKGKQVCSQAQDFLDDLREDPEYAKEQWQEKAEALDDSEEIVIDITEE
ncbi:exported hydrophilic protein [Streptococcus pneumoniae]|nr:YtxH domain-containing protein [Streptococcus pneumoniae]VSJ11673.1 exported hydrophilic protein [Streptococcus pneumoniae]